MPEIPGITPEAARLGGKIADSGFTVAIPSLLGTPGKEFSFPYVALQAFRVCVSREFHVLARRSSSPVTNWLRALCRWLHGEVGGPGVGAIGMCLTGNFALSLMVDPVVMAPVMSQPSLPLPLLPSHKKALQLSEAELARVKERVAGGIGVLGLRFSHDRVCPGQRFSTLKRELGDGFEAIEINSGPGNPHGISKMAHAVLTLDLVDEEGHPTRRALERVIAFLQERLMPGAST